MKIAVTAASGQLGGAIVKELSKTIGKENVIGIVRSPEKVTNSEIELRKGDYKNKAEFIEALKGIDALLLVSGNDEPLKRIPQHRNVIEAAKANGVKKIVYTSIIGAEAGNSFSPIVQSNRQTEADLKTSGLDWSIGRNNIYIEPDLEYLDTYTKEGEIRNCAGNGKCGYTSRFQLAQAYTQMLVDDQHSKQTYNLGGEAISQAELANYINQVYGTQLNFNAVSVEDYTKERQAALGNFLGTVIAGIYQGIKEGKYDTLSDFEKVTGSKHPSALEMIQMIKDNETK